MPKIPAQLGKGIRTVDIPDYGYRFEFNYLYHLLVLDKSKYSPRYISHTTRKERAKLESDHGYEYIDALYTALLKYSKRPSAKRRHHV
jgi:hypothetical protein